VDEIPESFVFRPPEFRVAHGIPTLLGNSYRSYSTNASDFCLSSESFLRMIRGFGQQEGFSQLLLAHSLHGC
ncbi:MAG: hypothetical protein ACLPZY_14100, partial [Terracidiphilus sp.]